MARNWYAYIGMGDPTLASSYSFSTVVPTCVNGCKICAVLAPGTATPTLSTNLRAYIIAGLVTSMQQPPPAVDLVRYLLMKQC